MVAPNDRARALALRWSLSSVSRTFIAVIARSCRHGGDAVKIYMIVDSCFVLSFCLWRCGFAPSPSPSARAKYKDEKQVTLFLKQRVLQEPSQGRSGELFRVCTPHHYAFAERQQKHVVILVFFFFIPAVACLFACSPRPLPIFCVPLLPHALRPFLTHYFTLLSPPPQCTVGPVDHLHRAHQEPAVQLLEPQLHALRAGTGTRLRECGAQLHDPRSCRGWRRRG